MVHDLNMFQVVFLPIPGQIKLILIFSSSEIEFLFVILYLLLDFYKHVRQKCVEK
jgi:hypothetical protein